MGLSERIGSVVLIVDGLREGGEGAVGVGVGVDGGKIVRRSFEILDCGCGMLRST